VFFISFFISFRSSRLINQQAQRRNVLFFFNVIFFSYEYQKANEFNNSDYSICTIILIDSVFLCLLVFFLSLSLPLLFLLFVVQTLINVLILVVDVVRVINNLFSLFVPSFSPSFSVLFSFFGENKNIHFFVLM